MSKVILSVDSSDTKYPLLHESREYNRLDTQHEAHKATMGGLYPRPLRDKVLDALSPSFGEIRRILDLGSGSGAWCIDMALEFPRAEVLGIDLQPGPTEGTPSNCNFLIRDINKGLSHFHGSYDLVHCRFANFGFKDHHASLKDSIKCLKPGGLIIFIDSLHLFKEDGRVYYDPATSTHLGGSWHQRTIMLSHHGTQILGNDIFGAAADLGRGFWDLEGCDPDTCGAIELSPPIGEWATVEDPTETAQLKHMGGLWYKSAHKIHWHLGKPLKASGRSDKDLEILHKKVDEEFNNLEHRTRIHIRVVWAQTPKVGQSIRRSEALTTQNQEENSLEETKFQLMKVFNDKSEWRSRNDAIRAALTSDMTSLFTVKGYDMLEGVI